MMIQVVTGPTAPPQAANLEEFPSLEHLIQDVVVNCRLAAVNVLHEDLQSPFCELWRKNHVDYGIGSSRR